MLQFTKKQQQDLDVKEFDLQKMEQKVDVVLTLRMGDSDRRFGFSVFGGYDDDTEPEVDDIVPGE